MADIRPQKGPQEMFLASAADIAIMGGAAGGGKSYGLLMEPLRHKANPGFGAVLFRREATQITNEGGIWDSALGLYPPTGARANASPKLIFRWESGARLTFGHLNTESDVFGWQGSQIPLLLFDELTHFSRAQFFYMLSRNRSTCGVKPYVRATCNPDADSWVADFIAWWIDQDTGFPIPARAGKLRWFIRLGDEIHWANTADELARRFAIPATDAKSVTFIPAKVTDNPALLSKDPGYLANLKALSRVERARLLDGNWKVRPSAGAYFNRSEATIIPRAPDPELIASAARGWDLASSEPTEATPDPDFTAGVKLCRTTEGRIVVLDVRRDRMRAVKVRTLVMNTARADGVDTHITIPQDPGQAGKDQAENFVAMLNGYVIKTSPVTKNKVARAEPFAAQWQAGMVDVVRAPWNEAFFSEMEAFPSADMHDDQVDACSDAAAELAAMEGATTAGAWSRSTR